MCGYILFLYNVKQHNINIEQKYIYIYITHSPIGLLGMFNISLMQLSNQPITWQLLQCI